jgi:hypothetical protein
MLLAVLSVLFCCFTPRIIFNSILSQITNKSPTCRMILLKTSRVPLYWKQSGGQIDTVPWTPACVHDGEHLKSANIWANTKHPQLIANFGSAKNLYSCYIQNKNEKERKEKREVHTMVGPKYAILLIMLLKGCEYATPAACVCNLVWNQRSWNNSVITMLLNFWTTKNNIKNRNHIPLKKWIKTRIQVTPMDLVDKTHIIYQQHWHKLTTQNHKIKQKEHLTFNL